MPAISGSQLWRILHEAGVRFTHHKTWKASPDPEFETKKNRILDLYAHPPTGARVLCLDEFGPLNLQPRQHDIELVFTPTYSSWLNLIECQFQALRSVALNGSDYQSHADQDAAIRAYLRWHNRNARPAKPWRLNAEVHHSLPNVAA